MVAARIVTLARLGAPAEKSPAALRVWRSLRADEEPGRGERHNGANPLDEPQLEPHPSTQEK